MASTVTPASRSLAATLSRCSIGALVIVMSPPVIAAAAIIDPASIRSGITSCSAPCSRSTPSISITCVPAPLIFAPILTSTRARSCTSGSRAAFSITVRPRAVTAAIKIFSVAPTDGESSQMRPPVELLGMRLDVAVAKLDLAAERADPRDMQIHRPRANRASAWRGYARASSPRQQRPEHDERRAHRLDQLVRRFVRGDFCRMQLDAMLVSPSCLHAELAEQFHRGLHVAQVAERW